MRVTDNNLPYDIGHYVLSGCENLTAVTLPDSLSEMGDEAFDDHVRLGPSTHRFARGCDDETDTNVAMVESKTKASPQHAKDVSENNRAVGGHPANPSETVTESSQREEVATAPSQQVENITRSTVVTVLTPPIIIMQAKDTHSLGAADQTQKLSARHAFVKNEPKIHPEGSVNSKSCCTLM